MADIHTSVWSETAASNTTAVNDGWPEGMAYSSVNDCAREMMGALKREWNRSHFTQTTTGSTTTATAYTLTYTTAPASIVAGMTFEAKFHATNGGAATLNVGDGSGAKAIRLMDGSIGLPAGVIPQNGLVRLVYDGTQFVVTSISDYAPAWLLLEAQDISSSTSAVTFTLPSRFKRFRFEWEGSRPVSDAALRGRIGISGAILTTASSYAVTVGDIYDGTHTIDDTAASSIPLTSFAGGTVDVDSGLQGTTGWLELNPADSKHEGLFMSVWKSGAELLGWRAGSFLTNQTGVIDRFQFSYATGVAVNINDGQFRMLGRI